ncbi:hypothetical protein, partial [Enterococcus faecalis]|uniref:hypothetical protein n=1 Tax=Enterococcus faecalis TaxID=1351 RepID=UPI00403F37CF
QDENFLQLTDELGGAAERILWVTICTGSNRDIRLRFIDGCLDNLAKNQSVIVSIKLLHKLFVSLSQDSKLIRKVVVDCEKQKNMLK